MFQTLPDWQNPCLTWRAVSAALAVHPMSRPIPARSRHQGGQRMMPPPFFWSVAGFHGPAFLWRFIRRQIAHWPVRNPVTRENKPDTTSALAGN